MRAQQGESMTRRHSVVKDREPEMDDPPALGETSKSSRRGSPQAITDLECSLEAPFAKRTLDWRLRVIASLSVLRGAFYDDISVGEEPGSLFEDVMIRAPRLGHEVERLRAEQRKLVVDMDVEIAHALLATESPEDTRARVQDLIRRLFHHRQHTADVVHQAYETDIGITD